MKNRSIIAFLVALSAFGLSSVSQTVGQVQGSDPCLNNVAPPNPVLMPGSKRVIQLVNCSNTPLLAAANAATPGPTINPTPVFPREGTWVMEGFVAGSQKNVLTIDVPEQWQDTKCHGVGSNQCPVGIVGPRLWARTGCRTNNAFDKAQCETGGCSGRYDCSAARLGSSVGTTVSEWTLVELPDGQTDPNFCPANPTGPSKCLDHPDISAVDGVNLNMDIRQVGGSGTNPTAPSDQMWLAINQPLVQYSQDLREPLRCPANFRLRRSDLVKGDTIPPQAPAGFVIVDTAGVPVGGDSTVACFSNCGRYAFGSPWPLQPNTPFSLGPPPENCDQNADKTSVCYRWKVFCAGDPKLYQPTLATICQVDTDCQPNVLQSCWTNQGGTAQNRCNARGFIRNATCLPTVCTFSNPLSGGTFPEAQPPFGFCNQLQLKAGETLSQACIGDDTMHDVMNKAYTWPNDPQVFGANAPRYQVIFAPGGTGRSAPPITKMNPIPLCSTMNETVYDTAQNTINCGNPIKYGANFGVAHRKASNNLWSCDLDPTGAGDEGVICRWDQSLTNKVQQVGLRANFNLGGSDLQLRKIPDISNGDLLIASITFQAGTSPTPPDSTWKQVPGASSMNQNNQTMVWYHFVTDASTEPASYTWTWNVKATPSGGLTAWRGVDQTTPFDGTAAVSNGMGATAKAPSIITSFANSQLLSVFGAGGVTGLAFGLPVNPTVGIDETGAVKVNVAGNQSYFPHLVGTRIQAAGTTLEQSVALTSSSVAPPPVDPANSLWTAISFALKAANP